MILLYIGEQLFVARDYNELKDELEEKNDEIRVLKKEFESAKGLISCQENRLVITSSLIIIKHSIHINPPIGDSREGNTRVKFLKYHNLFPTLFANMTCTIVIAVIR